MKFLSILLLIFTFCTGIAFQQKAILSATEKPNAIQDCSDFATITTDYGILCNNVWNKKAAQSQSWCQCIQDKDDKEIGWTWQWPDGSKDYVIYAYPQIKIGRSPWDPMPCTDDRFPLSINQLQELQITYDIISKTDGEHNLATTLWIVDSDKKIVQRNPGSIQAEVMIWTYTTANHLNPAGSKYAEITVDGLVWEVWAQKNWEDPSGQNANKWNNITFRLKKNLQHISFDAHKLLLYGIKEKIIPKNSFVADIEVGNEIMKGSGKTWIKTFEVSIE